MPVSVHLSNFGSATRADATVTYTVIDVQKNVLLSTTETVAVETSASFLHTLLLPRNIAPGQYTVQVSVTYAGQEMPAVSSYQFIVERKIGGFFISDLIRYGLFGLAGMLVVLYMVWLSEKYRHATRRVHDYSDIPSTQRMYYEIISDIIQKMRVHEGDKALSMAGQLPGLVVNDESGEVINISGDPATIMASLVSGYEETFGKRINLSLKKSATGYAIIKDHKHGRGKLISRTARR